MRVARTRVYRRFSYHLCRHCRPRRRRRRRRRRGFGQLTEFNSFGATRRVLYSISRLFIRPSLPPSLPFLSFPRASFRRGSSDFSERANEFVSTKFVRA